MSEQLRESISALMDGEADELELRRLLSTASDEHATVIDETWSRYHLVRDVMQNNNQDHSFRQLDISHHVSAAIDRESVSPAVDQSSSLLSRVSWLKPMAGFAVAASVTVAVVVGVRSIDPLNPGLNPPVATQTAGASRVYPIQGASLQASEGSAAAVTYRNTALPGGIANSRAAANLDAQKRLDKYILRHTERAALNNGQGMMSFARVANFEAE